LQYKINNDLTVLLVSSYTGLTGLINWNQLICNFYVFRTKVYSGNRHTLNNGVPKLFDLCMQVIQDNLHEMGDTGGIPFDILKPALERATVDQLLAVENVNEYLQGTPSCL